MTRRGKLELHEPQHSKLFIKTQKNIELSPCSNQAIVMLLQNLHPDLRSPLSNFHVIIMNDVVWWFLFVHFLIEAVRKWWPFKEKLFLLNRRQKHIHMSGSKGKWLWLDSVYSFIIAKFNWFIEMEAKLGVFISVLFLVLSLFSSSPVFMKITHRGLLKLNQLVDGTD